MPDQDMHSPLLTEPVPQISGHEVQQRGPTKRMKPTAHRVAFRVHRISHTTPQINAKTGSSFPITVLTIG
jgi:hypothetical protein